MCSWLNQKPCKNLGKWRQIDDRRTQVVGLSLFTAEIFNQQYPCQLGNLAEIQNWSRVCSRDKNRGKKFNRSIAQLSACAFNEWWTKAFCWVVAQSIPIGGSTNVSIECNAILKKATVYSTEISVSTSQTTWYHYRKDNIFCNISRIMIDVWK